MELNLEENTVKLLKELAEIKDITVNEAANKVLDLYTKKHLNMVKRAYDSADKVIERSNQ
mgnify:FL=1